MVNTQKKTTDINSIRDMKDNIVTRNDKLKHIKRHQNTE